MLVLKTNFFYKLPSKKLDLEKNIANKSSFAVKVEAAERIGKKAICQK